MLDWGFEDNQPTHRKRISKKDKEMIYKSQKCKCMYCGKKIQLDYMHIDHKTPLSRKGSNNLSNLHLICAPCNNRKGSLTDGEFRRKYKLTPSRKAINPPSKLISQKYFNEISTKSSKLKAAKKRKNKTNDPFGFWGF